MTQTVTDGNGTTHFFDVYPGKRTRNPNEVIGRSMLFIPLAATPVEQMTMLVYYHGHHGPSKIEGYVGSIKERDFRPLLKSKKVLLVEPQGGPVSRFGDLATPAGLTTLIDQAMFIALSFGPSRSMPAPGTPTPKPKALIIAGFSGGGKALNSVVLDSKADYLNRLTEVWSFDSMYWAEGKRWVDWARAPGNAKKTLRVRLSDEEDSGSPRGQAKIIRDAIKAAPTANIDIADTVHATHEALPGLFIPGWL
jgi:hypothetical protein